MVDTKHVVQHLDTAQKYIFASTLQISYSSKKEKLVANSELDLLACRGATNEDK